MASKAFAVIGSLAAASSEPPGCRPNGTLFCNALCSARAGGGGLNFFGTPSVPTGLEDRGAQAGSKVPDASPEGTEPRAAKRAWRVPAF